MSDKFLNKIITSDTRYYIHREVYWELSKIVKVVGRKLKIVDPESSNRRVGSKVTFSFCQDVDSFLEEFLCDSEKS